MYYWSSERHGLSILNAEEMSDVAKRFTQADDQGQISLEPVPMLDYEVEDRLKGFTIMPLYKVSHIRGDQKGEFDGMYIAEEFHGGTHPMLLLPSDKVTKKG